MLSRFLPALSLLLAVPVAAQTTPGPLLLSNGQPAFVEVVGPDGADPCGPSAGSTFGCAEVGGNAVYVLDATAGPDANGTGVYALRAEGPGPEAVIGTSAPNDFEIRFTERGSIASRLFGEGDGQFGAHRVPFEMWNLGVSAPGQPDSPVDDERMIPILLSDDAGNGRDVCDFAFGEIPAAESPFGVPETDRIYAYPATNGYPAYEAAAAPLVDAAPDACYRAATTELASQIDQSGLRPLQRLVFADLGAGSVDALQGTIVRFYSTDDGVLDAPALIGPADEATFTPPEGVRLEWEPVAGATAYRVRLSADADFGGRIVFDEVLTATALDVPPEALLAYEDGALFWGVVPLGETANGPASPARSFSYTFAFQPDVLALSNGQFAFVEVVGPGGADPCGPAAGSTFGCDEVGGNAVYVTSEAGEPDANGTGTYALRAPAAGPEGVLAPFAPRDFELRFTGTSIATHLFGEADGDEMHRVPFEVWDIGVVAPGEANDPADDVRLIPVLLSDDGGDGRGVCAFDLAEVPAAEGAFGVPESDRIYAYYPTTTYAAFDAVAAPLVDAAPDGCIRDTDGVVGQFIDTPRGRPLQRITVADLTGSGDVAALDGTVIRFYTTDPQPVDGEAAPAVDALALAVAPNPSRGAARVRFALAEPGTARVRVLDVLGRTVAVLADGERRAGTHEVALPAGLASGVYVVAVEAGGERMARSFTVVR